jgi:hypothetical protein
MTKARTYRDERMLREQTTLEKWFEHFGGDMPDLGRPATKKDVLDYLETRFPPETFDRDTSSDP